MQILEGSNVTQLRRPVHGSSFHYKDFLVSKGGYDGSFEDPHGFILYKKVSEHEMCIGELYVEPSKRQLGIGKELADRVKELAIAQGCTLLSCRTNLTGNEDHLSILAILHYGFRPVQAHNNEIVYVMPIGGA